MVRTRGTSSGAFEDVVGRNAKWRDKKTTCADFGFNMSNLSQQYGGVYFRTLCKIVHASRESWPLGQQGIAQGCALHTGGLLHVKCITQGAMQGAAEDKAGGPAKSDTTGIGRGVGVLRQEPKTALKLLLVWKASDRYS